MVDKEYKYEAYAVSDEVYDEHMIGMIYEDGIVIDGIGDLNEVLGIDTGILITRREYDV